MLITIERQKVTEVTEQMCDEYCRWPMNTGTQEELNRFCEECPLNNMLCVEFPKHDDEDSDNPWQE